jgi:protein gp37
VAENSKIEWCDHTFNPWIGCTKVGPGCDLCYAEARDIRWEGGVHWGPGAPRRCTSAAAWRKPLEWDRQALKTYGRRARVFCASLADVFDNEVDPAWRTDLWDLVRKTPNIEWLMLTKRRPNVEKMLPPDWGWGFDNVRLGHTFVNQDEVKRDARAFLEIPSKLLHFCSLEPLLGPIALDRVYRETEHAVYSDNLLTGERGTLGGTHSGRRFGWVICGGESGSTDRFVDPAWVQSLRDQCAAAGVPFLFKQWGEWAPYAAVALEMGVGFTESPTWRRINSGKYQATHVRSTPQGTMCKVGKHLTGRKLDGLEHTEFPQ